MGESKCLHSGDFSLQNKGVFKSSWVKKYGILYGKTPDQHAYLEIYDSQESFIENKGKGKQSEKKYELQHVKAVNLKVEKNSKGGTDYQIEIIFTRGQKIFMMFENKTQSDDWHTKLSLAADIADGDHRTSDGPSLSIEHELENDDDDSDGSDDEVITLNQMYGGGQSNVQKFSVTVEPSPLAKLCGVEGEMTIMLSDQQTMRFEDSKTHKSMYSFQLAWMRRFGKKGPSHFYFECGRKCPNGEGTVTCQTESAKAMHKAITQLSKSRSDIVIPSSRKKEDKHSKVPAEEPRAAITGQITAPSLASNMRRNHPGMQKMPTLIPIQQPSNGDATFYDDAPSSPLRSSAGSVGSPVEAPSRSSGKSKLSKPDIVQELSEKVGTMIKKDDQKSIKSKDELKKEKKEKERREKEEKKERERKEKEEKREKEKREKDEKKKSKKIESTDMPVKKRSKGERIYDEPEVDYDNNQVVDDTYDTAISPTPDTKQQPAKKRSVIKPDALYEDAEPACNNAASAQSAVEYAQPYIKKGGVPIPAQGVVYAEVGNVTRAAWKEQGRTDEETVHEENYSNIKEAREEISNPPSLPERGYSDSDDDDGENMYNTANLIPGKAKRLDNKKPENIYGIKSAKPAGPIMPDPAADYSSAEDEEEEEGDYAEAEEGPGYEDPKILMKAKTRAPAPIDGAYEETELAQAKPVKPSKIPPKPMSLKKPHPVVPQPQESLYEVVGKP